MTSLPADVLTLADRVWARLQAIDNLTSYDGEIVDADGNTHDAEGKLVSPPKGEDGRVNAYVIFYPSAGVEQAVLLEQGADTLAWSFQITCAGGDRTRALWCVRKVRRALSGWHIPTTGDDTAVIREAGDPGPLRRDEDVTPNRFYLPLLFSTTA